MQGLLLFSVREIFISSNGMLVKRRSYHVHIHNFNDYRGIRDSARYLLYRSSWWGRNRFAGRCDSLHMDRVQDLWPQKQVTTESFWKNQRLSIFFKEK